MMNMMGTHVSGLLSWRTGSLGEYSWWNVALGLLCISVFYYILRIIYNLFFHPLASYPGPRLAAATPLWIMSSSYKGTSPRDLLQVHEKYGTVVRVGPNQLSYLGGGEPWRQIYTRGPQGQPELEKDESLFAGLEKSVILNAKHADHVKVRKLFAPGFSEKALRQQEEVLREHVELLCERLRGLEGQKVDLVQWYNFTTFDFIGFLTFGESFGCLKTSTLNIWIVKLIKFAKFVAFVQLIQKLPLVLRPPTLLWVMPAGLKSDVQIMKTIEKEKVNHRLHHEPMEHDLMKRLINAYHDGEMSLAQLEGNAQTMIAGGSETTGTLLSGLTYLLLTHPESLARLQHELRTAFPTFGDISTVTSVRLNECKYLLACIEEALRLYPPFPNTQVRVMRPGGGAINGKWVPGGTLIGVPALAAARWGADWAEAEIFAPERWLLDDDESRQRFGQDNKDASQPFSMGPRNCVGRNLAYAELKMVLARVLWEFDLDNKTQGDWLDQKVWMIWDKPPLWAVLRSSILVPEAGSTS